MPYSFHRPAKEFYTMIGSTTKSIITLEQNLALRLESNGYMVKIQTIRIKYITKRFSRISQILQCKLSKLHNSNMLHPDKNVPFLRTPEMYCNEKKTNLLHFIHQTLNMS